MAPSFENSRLMTLSFEKTSFVDKLARPDFGEKLGLFQYMSPLGGVSL